MKQNPIHKEIFNFPSVSEFVTLNTLNYKRKKCTHISAPKETNNRAIFKTS